MGVVKADDFRSVPPGLGAAPKFEDQVIGMRVSVDVEAGIPVLMDQLLA